MSENKVVVNETVNNVVVATPGPQGPRGRTILNGTGVPSNNLGLEGDFYYNTVTTEFYGPKLTDLTWSGANVITLFQEPTDFSFAYTWEIGQVTGPVQGIYSVAIQHNMGFYPNVTVKTSAGDILETGIDYNNINQITLTMAQPFSGTAYLS
jgi:hypothetical protein